MTARSSGAPELASRHAARDVGAVGAASTGIGAALVTLVAGACCISPVLAPLIVGLLGASGAVWVASLKPYAWWVLALAGSALVAGFWTVYRPRTACAIGDFPKRSRLMPRIAKISLWFGAICWTAALMLRLMLPQ